MLPAAFLCPAAIAGLLGLGVYCLQDVATHPLASLRAGCCHFAHIAAGILRFAQNDPGPRCHRERSEGSHSRRHTTLRGRCNPVMEQPRASWVGACSWGAWWLPPWRGRGFLPEGPPLPGCWGLSPRSLRTCEETLRSRRTFIYRSHRGQCPRDAARRGRSSCDPPRDRR